ncbi:MAG: alpha-N-arabinofuranosidase [Actinobacteria bacterium]|nr:alpha-N-arabinofuranosidase [Actinomycetota bacterium]
MTEARITVDPAFRIGPVDPRVYGSFVEHLGRCVYTGIYEPEHPTADEHGFRRDVADLTRELGVPIIRYPGGNFVSGYRWEDGIGPVEERPARLDLAWRSTEPNAVGTDEFCAWTRRVGSAPMLAVNLGTRGPDAAARLVEYCNHPGGTYWSDLRVKNGAAQPHVVRVWCLGNEMDGPWQIGHKTAEEYGRVATETARAMRLVDPGIELVACGSSGAGMPTFGDWEATMLGHCYDQVDYVSLHSYYAAGEDQASFLACATGMDNFIEAVIATADHVRARGRHAKRINLSFDEWNVWHTLGQEADGGWQQAPRLIEDEYNLTDAVVVGNMLISLLRHADRVRMACQAQLVNAIGAIRSEPGGPAWRQTIFHPFALTSRHGRGTVLRTPIAGPEYDTPAFGRVPEADAVAVLSDSGDELTVFAVNRDAREPLPAVIDVRSLPALRVARHTYVGDDEPSAVNTADAPDRILPRAGADVRVDSGVLRIILPPLSWNMLRIGGEDR